MFESIIGRVSERINIWGKDTLGFWMPRSKSAVGSVLADSFTVARDGMEGNPGSAGSECVRIAERNARDIVVVNENDN